MICEEGSRLPDRRRIAAGNLKSNLFAKHIPDRRRDAAGVLKRSVLTILSWAEAMHQPKLCHHHTLLKMSVDNHRERERKLSLDEFQS